MAQQEHLNLIKQNIATWNAWKKQHPKIQADLSDADLRRANFSGVNLSGANLSGAYLSGAHLYRANLSDADLSGAHLVKADLSRANLSRANLDGVDLFGADLSGTDLIRANLNKAHLTGAHLNGANLSDADLSYARIGWTHFGDHDLRVIKGLETIQHAGPSPLSINTIYQSEGDIPEAFVRGTGAPDSFLEYMHALTAKPIQYYTCFISYSSKDQDFAERLYADLQSKNIRCWFAPENLKIGDKIRARIDESIHIHDKLLLVLSHHSIASSWVEKEVETAFEKEQRHHKSVLFPIMLDDTVMRTNQAWAADISRTRHIGDFTRWKEHDAYQKGLQRLLRDLKAEKTKQDV